MEPFCAALVRSWRGGESTTITCVTKSSVILPSQLFPASRVGTGPRRLANFRDRACLERKGDIADCTSYRPIRLLCHTMKVFERVPEARLRKIVSVSLNQCDFVKDCSTIDAIHAARILLEKHREKNRSVLFSISSGNVHEVA
ncbi:hypothetical protein RB195_002234 [Necator americanus]|uniref:Reverse transcriptase domain-containing protein n=1 Tax=Necator americanus TaxID=51031 RepID=A0ABR1DJJ9_NECAM